MKKVLMTLCGVAMLSIATLAQQTDTTRIYKNSEQKTESGPQDQNSDRATHGQTQTQDQSTPPAPTQDQSTTTDQPVDNGQNGNTTTPQDQATQSMESDKDRKKAKKSTP